MQVLQWLVINTILPLSPIGFFYLGIWMATGSITWVPPIRDGQICFYSTTIAIITIKDIFSANAAGVMPFFGLAACWLVSFFVYGFSIYSTIYPSPIPALKLAIDIRVALASIACGIFTTAMVIGLRLHYGVLT
jgi:hypothetical protein